MSYARPLETGTYIWSDGEYMHFGAFDKVSEDDINIFLAKINDTRKDELEERIKKGRKLIEQNKLNLDEVDKNDI